MWYFLINYIPPYMIKKIPEKFIENRGIYSI